MGKKVFVDLSHPFSSEAPRWPYFEKPTVTSSHTMAKSGVLDAVDQCAATYRYAL